MKKLKKENKEKKLNEKEKKKRLTYFQVENHVEKVGRTDIDHSVGKKSSVGNAEFQKSVSVIE